MELASKPNTVKNERLLTLAWKNGSCKIIKTNP